MRRSVRRHRGLTLLELLVAFAIMAMSLGVLYRVMGGAARSVDDMEGYQQAVVLAQSILALRDAVPEGGWNQQGVSGRYHWQVTSAPYPTPVSGAGPQVPVLHEVGISIYWERGGRERRMDLQTLRPQRRPVQGAR